MPVPTLAAIQRDTAELGVQNGWPDKSVPERALYLVSEVGELADELIRWTHCDSDGLESIGEEMYDVIWNVCDLARLLGIDLDEAADRKARQNESRTW